MGLFISRMCDVFATFGKYKPARILMLGLDAAGKTTILYKIKLNETIETIPTIGFNVESVSPCRGVTFTIWDVGGGGRRLLHNLRRRYFQGIEGVIFVVDSNDRERIVEVREELHDILELLDTSSVPIVIIANKQDLSNTMTSSEIIEKLDMQALPGKHKWHLQSTCALTGDGLSDSLLKMVTLVEDYRKENN